jgi:hypothetical protein
MRRAPIILLLAAAGASADVIYQTSDPYFGPNGPPAFTLTDEQAVALRFTPDRDYTLDTVRTWIISDNTVEVSHAPVRVQLREGDPLNQRPAGAPIEEMQFEVSTVGWNPVLESVQSRMHPLLRAGVSYWIVLACDLHSDAPGWCWSSASTGFISLSYGGQINFNQGGQGAVTSTIIEGTPACYANCDRSTLPPILNINDFACFMNAFAMGDRLANCDSSTTAPILNANDFQCFLNAFAAGCL